MASKKTDSTTRSEDVNIDHEGGQTSDDFEAMLAQGVNDDYAHIVVTLHEVDIKAEYERLKSDLEPDKERTKLGVIYAYVDRCEDNARRALQLVCMAKVEHETLKMRLEHIKAGMREASASELNEEHDKGARAKAPTLADIDARMRLKYADEFEAQERQLLKSKNTVEYLDEFAKLWCGRCTRAGGMLGAVRK